MTKILILLSTYNGEKYIKEQIESLLNQKNVDFDILVRDDGSKDATTAILDSYQKNNILTWYQGQNLKPAKSFMDLVSKAGEYDFYSFCDQDDFWEQNKLEQALNFLKNSDADKLALYFSNTKLVDENMHPMESNRIKTSLTFEESLIRNPATGCTMVFNKKLMDYLKMYSPDFLLMHDSWTYQLCLALGGDLYFDENSYIHYRQHSSNAIGGKESAKSRFKRRFKVYFDKDAGQRYLNSRQLMSGYKTYIESSNLKSLQDILDYKTSLKKKFKLIFLRKFRTPYTVTNIGFVISILFNKY